MEAKLPRKLRLHNAPSRGRVKGAPFAGIFFFLLIIRFAFDRVFGAASFALGPIDVTPGVLFNLFFVSLASIFFAYSFLDLNGHRSDAVLAATLWLPFLLSVAGSITYSLNFSDGMKYLWNLLTFSSLFFLGLFYSRHLSLQTFYRMIVYSGILPILGSLAYFVIDGFSARLTGVTSHPNILAFFLFFYVSFSYHGILWGWIEAGNLRRLAIAFAVFAIAELLLTGTRSAFIALYVFIVISSFKRPALLAVVLPAPFIAFLIPGVHDRLSEILNSHNAVNYDYFVAVARGDVDAVGTIDADSGSWRVFLWKAAWPAILRAPILGHGAATFLPLSPTFFPLAAEGGSPAHNIYVQILFEEGVLGLVTYLWLVFGVALIAIFRLNQNPSLAIFILLIDATFAVASFSDNLLYYLIDQIYVWLAIGFALGGLYPKRMGNQHVRLNNNLQPDNRNFQAGWRQRQRSRLSSNAVVEKSRS